MKKNTLAVMICAAIFSVLFAVGAFAAESPSGTAEGAIAGTWIYGDQSAAGWTYEKWTDKNFFSAQALILFEFREDGTYLRRFRAYNTFGDDFLEHKGKYRVEGNKIIVYDRIETYTDFYYPKESYTDKALAGEYTYYYQFTRSGHGEYAADALFIESSLEALSNTNWHYHKK